MGGHILEILVMLIIAAILGFLIGWLLRKSKIKVLEDYNTALEIKNNRLQADFNELDGKLIDCQAERKKLEAEVERLKKLLSICNNNLDKYKESAVKEEIKPAIKKVKNEVSDKPVSKQDAALQRVKDKAKNIDFDRIGIVDAGQKDNLQIIKGIGPFIEKKLNALGIYTFKQIANFNDDDKDKVNDAIEFFPGRIKRDDWVGQAIKLK